MADSILNAQQEQTTALPLKSVYQKTTKCLRLQELITVTIISPHVTDIEIIYDTETMAPTEDYYNTYHITKRIQTNVMYILSTFWIRPSKI